MASSFPPALASVDTGFPESEVPSTAKSRVRPTEEFVRAVADRMIPVRIEIVRAIGRNLPQNDRLEIDGLFDDSQDEIVPSDEVLEKLARCESPDDFLGVIDAILEEDKKKRRHKGI